MIGLVQWETQGVEQGHAACDIKFGGASLTHHFHRRLPSTLGDRRPLPGSLPRPVCRRPLGGSGLVGRRMLRGCRPLRRRSPLGLCLLGGGRRDGLALGIGIAVIAIGLLCPILGWSASLGRRLTPRLPRLLRLPSPGSRLGRLAHPLWRGRLIGVAAGPRASILAQVQRLVQALRRFAQALGKLSCHGNA